ncbi:hypothetical protein EDD11_007535 [Mortierella claussenii]|nr:hypothetical protein EDD11_007535 [Mortierella claussenii]
MDLEDDVLLAEAIRRSLAESNVAPLPPSGSAQVRSQLIDLTDDTEPPIKVEGMDNAAAVVHAKVPCTTPAVDEEDGELKRALALSLASPSVAKSAEQQTHEPALAQSTPSIATEQRAVGTISSSLAFAGLSRADMERERQERIKRSAMVDIGSLPVEQNGNRAKKQRSSDGTSSILYDLGPSSRASPPLPSVRATKTITTPASSSIRPASSSTPNSTPALGSHSTEPSTTPLSLITSSTSSSSYGAQAYPPKYTSATFMNTCIAGAPLGNWEIRIEDLVDKRHIIKAVLTTFQLDEAWLEKYLPRSITQCLISHWSKESGDQPGFLTQGKVTYLHPPLNGFGTFHPKLMLLFYPTFCRVVVSSANLVEHDWQQLVNTVFVQDFLLLPAVVNSPEDMGEFGAALHNYLKVMTVPDKILSVLMAVDFSRAKIHLIPSVQGSFPVASEHTYGAAQLAKVMQSRVSLNQDMEIEYQTSSLGKLTLRFLSEFYRASKGHPVRARTRLNDDERMPPIKVVFPTERHVQSSRLGELGAGTICFQDQYWLDPTYPRRVMHDFECVGGLRGSLMHTKLVIARSIEAPNTIGNTVACQKQSGEARKCAGWFYVGSANFTESAWGSVTSKKAASTKPGGLHITMRNWELGIVYVVETEEEMEAMATLVKAQGLNRDGEQSFFGPLPIPYKRPLKPYTATDRPWIR